MATGRVASGRMALGGRMACRSALSSAQPTLNVGTAIGQRPFAGLGRSSRLRVRGRVGGTTCGARCCWSLSSTGTFSQLWGLRRDCRVRASSRKGVFVVVQCASAAMENNRQKCKEIETGEAQGAPPAKKNWSQKDLRDDLNYLGMCIQQGEENALKKVELRRKYATDHKRCPSEAEKARLEQDFDQEVKEIKERSKVFEDMLFDWNRRFKTLEVVKEKLGSGAVEPTAGGSGTSASSNGEDGRIVQMSWADLQKFGMVAGQGGAQMVLQQQPQQPQRPQPAPLALQDGAASYDDEDMKAKDESLKNLAEMHRALLKDYVEDGGNVETEIKAYNEFIDEDPVLDTDLEITEEELKEWKEGAGKKYDEEEVYDLVIKAVDEYDGGDLPAKMGESIKDLVARALNVAQKGSSSCQASNIEDVLKEKVPGFKPRRARPDFDDPDASEFDSDEFESADSDEDIEDGVSRALDLAKIEPEKADKEDSEEDSENEPSSKLGPNIAQLLDAPNGIGFGESDDESSDEHKNGE